MMLVEINPDFMIGEKPKYELKSLPSGYGGSVFIAGGSVRRWFTGEKQNSDVDLFFTDSETLETYFDNTYGKEKDDHGEIFKSVHDGIMATYMELAKKEVGR
jgi:hypothetical protein